MKKLKEFILKSPIGYGLWAVSHNKPKIVAINKLLKKNQKLDGKVLDVGCGPGSSAPIFANDYDYLGVDLNPEYIESATKLYPKKVFKVGDATKLDLKGQKFDIILINSLMHHLNDQECHKLITDIKPLLADSGIVIIQEPLIPEKKERFMTLMMKQDLGNYFRNLEDWRKISSLSNYEIIDEDFYKMKIFGLTGWNMYSALLTIK